MCEKCMKTCGVLMLIFGILFLFQDVGVWNFWGIHWWTVMFLLMGVGALSALGCEDCKAIMKKK